MSERDGLIEAVADTARDWREPDYAPRAEAVRKTLEADNAFTDEAVAFAINQQMSLLTVGALIGWLQGRRAAQTRTVAVLNAGNIPLVGLQDLLAVLLTGHRYAGTTSSKSPVLLPAFVDDLRQRRPELDVTFGSASEVFGTADAAIATGSNETIRWVEEQCDHHGIAPGRRLLRGHSYAVAVLDGDETEEDYDRLAEDTLLHEGFGCRNVALIWAPRGLPPDGLLDAFARFRGVFPAHANTPGRLAMQQAFLEAVDRPHAYGAGLEFLVSRGDSEAQQPGHVRWSEYEDVTEVSEWLRTHAREVQLVAARSADRLEAAAPIVPFGEAQRPPLDRCPDGVDTIAFLVRLDPA